jgi:drug/metabolite transporter (DMT)-like permease
MVCVGGSVAVSGVLARGPMLTAEAVRYAAACLLLVALARLTGRRLAMPRGTEWLWLSGIAAGGLVLFNVGLVEGAAHAEPAVLGVAVACVPAVLAAIGPLLEGTRPRGQAVAAALVVTCGAALVQGVGRADAIGVAWAAVVFGCEAGFTLLAIPLLPRHGPWGVSAHATWLAALIFGVLGVARDGPAAAAHLDRPQWLAIGYLAVAVTAVAFVLWYSSVGWLGADRAGLLAGVAPVAAAATGVLLGGPAPRPPVWAGIAVVAVGLALGLRGREDLCGLPIPPPSGATFPRSSPASSTPRVSPARCQPARCQPARCRPARCRPASAPEYTQRSPSRGWRPAPRASCRRYRRGGAPSRRWA